MLSISCNLLNIIQKVKNRTAVSLNQLFALVIMKLKGDAADQHHESVLYYILLAQEKIKIQKFEVEFLVNAYCFHTIIELNNCKLNHCKLETYL